MRTDDAATWLRSRLQCWCWRRCRRKAANSVVIADVQLSATHRCLAAAKESDRHRQPVGTAIAIRISPARVTTSAGDGIATDLARVHVGQPDAIGLHV